MKGLGSQFAQRKKTLNLQRTQTQGIERVLQQVHISAQTTIADVVKTISFKNGILTLITTSKTAANEVLMHKQTLQDAARAQNITIKEIVVR